MTGKTRPWRLWGLADPRLDTVLTVVTVALLAWSRLAYLASGPWEWDEVAFARGIYAFDLAAYFPHPPGYPGWLAVGHLLTPLVGEAMVALQVASSLFSIGALWVLAALGRKVAPPAIAVSAALVVLAAPGPWLYSVRGFTSTAAGVLALGAGLVAVRGLEGRRLTAFSLLVTSAFLVRPNLLPPLAILWVGVGVGIRPLKRLLPGVAAGSAAVVAAVALMVKAQGGWGLFIAPFLSHSQRHFSRLVLNVGGFSDLGLVKGLGGPAVATLIFVLSAIGIAVWARRAGPRQAALWVTVLAIAVGQLIWMQNRTYCRYSVGVQIALAPLVAGAVALAPPAVGAVGLLGLAGWFGFRGLPLVAEQHETELASWTAVREAEAMARHNGQIVVMESELHLFASYHWHDLERKGEQPPRKVLTPRTPEPWAGIDRSFLLATVHENLYLPSLTGGRRAWGGVSDRLEPLTQQRFLEAVVLDNPPLPVGQWWPREVLPDGRFFMWAGADAQIWLAPVPAGSWIGVEVQPAPGEDSLFVGFDGEDMVEVDGRSPRRWVWFLRSADSENLPVVISLTRARSYPPGNGDERPLSAQLSGVEVRVPGTAFGGEVAEATNREKFGLVIDGCYGAEKFGAFETGVWLNSESRWRMDLAEPGRLRLRFRAPRPTPPCLRLSIGGTTEIREVDLTAAESIVEIVVAAEDVLDRKLEIEILSNPFIPAKEGLSQDRRRLGVVFTGLEFVPDAEPLPGWWTVDGKKPGSN